MKRSRSLGVDTRASAGQAVVLTWWPTRPAGIEGCGWVAEPLACAVPAALAELAVDAGFSVA
jgi:hypothetical protein